MSHKFTFKKEPRETGLRGVGYPNPGTQIKHNKKEVGTIFGPNWQTEDNKWGINLAVIHGNSWKWVRIKRRFDSEPEARQWLQDNAKQVIETLNLYHFED